MPENLIALLITTHKFFVCDTSHIKTIQHMQNMRIKKKFNKEESDDEGGGWFCAVGGKLIEIWLIVHVTSQGISQQTKKKPKRNYKNGRMNVNEWNISTSKQLFSCHFWGLLLKIIGFWRKTKKKKKKTIKINLISRNILLARKLTEYSSFFYDIFKIEVQVRGLHIQGLIYGYISKSVRAVTNSKHIKKKRWSKFTERTPVNFL